MFVWRAFYGFDASDESSYVAAAYSLLTGSDLFVDCWDVHQTSSFLLAPLVWVYTSVVGGTVGILLFMRIAYALLSFLLALALFLSLVSRSSSRETTLWALAAAALIQFGAPAGIHTLSYNTIAILCLAASVLFVSKGHGRFAKFRIYASGLCSGLAVMSYPFMAFALLPLAGAMISCSKKIRDLRLVEAGIIWVAGGVTIPVVFIIVLFVQNAPDVVVANIGNVFTDPEHGDSGSVAKILNYFTDALLQMGPCVVIALGVSACLACLSRFSRLKPFAQSLVRAMLLLFVAAGVLMWLFRVLVSGRADITQPGLVVFGVALLLQPLVVAWWHGPSWPFWLDLVGFSASLGCQVGSNVGFALSSSFCILSLIGCFAYFSQISDYRQYGALDPACPSRWGKAVRTASVCLFLSLLVSFGVIAGGRVLSVYRDAPIEQLTCRIDRGPAAGLFTTPQSCEWYNSCYEAITKYGQRAQSVFIGVLFPTGYLMLDAEVYAPRVWRTALNASDLESWYLKHPDERPDLIFVKDGTYWQYDRFPAGEFCASLKSVIEKGGYEKIETPGGTIYRKMN
ncbi:MAG: hypothetical protein UCH28_09760 [Adlercreutzia sp.]|nr:hypothetical protein [Adlercreutzia sp.]